MKLNPAPEVLADEDILEMVNAGLAPMTIVDDDIAELWKHDLHRPDASIRERLIRHGRPDGHDDQKEQPAADGGAERVCRPALRKARRSGTCSSRSCT